jgi:hypothetical protein
MLMQNFAENGHINNHPLVTGTERSVPLTDREPQQLEIIGRLTANIVHELNNPMQTIRGCASLALEDISNADDLIQYLNRIQQASGRAMDLIVLVRSLYAQSNGAARGANLPELFQSLMPLLKDDLNRQGVELIIASQAQPVFGTVVEPAVRLLLLNLVLDLDQFLADCHIKNYDLRVFKNETAAGFEFTLPVEEPQLLDKLCSSIFTRSQCKQTNGTLSVKVQEGCTKVRVILPAVIEEGTSQGG